MSKIAIFGDSISTFEDAVAAGNRIYYQGDVCKASGVEDVSDTWWGILANRQNAEVSANASFSGSMVEGPGFPAGSSHERAAQIIGAEGEKPDKIYVFIGVNDYGWGSPEAQEAGGSEAAPSRYRGQERVDPAGLGAESAEDSQVAHSANEDSPEHSAAAIFAEAPAGAVEDFGAAYREMLENLNDQAPEAEILCMTIPPGRLAGTAEPTFCNRLRGIPLEKYNEKIVELCASPDLPNVRALDIAALGYDYESTDGTHPTVLGMRQLAAMAEAAEEERVHELAPELFSESMRSQAICDEACAHGCVHARATWPQWLCVCESRL